MAKYLKLFETTSQYNTYINGTPDLPNVSLCEDNNGVHYTRLVPVTGITLNKQNVSLDVNDTTTITATVLPSNASNKNVTWSTSNGNKVSITGSGNTVTLTALAEAQNVTITCTSAADNTKSATCSVNVVVPFIPVQSVTVDKHSVTVPARHYFSISSEVLPSNVTDKRVEWTSSDTDIIQYHGRRTGEVEIYTNIPSSLETEVVTLTATSVIDNTKYDTCQVTVQVNGTYNTLLSQDVDYIEELKDITPCQLNDSVNIKGSTENGDEIDFTFIAYRSSMSGLEVIQDKLYLGYTLSNDVLNIQFSAVDDGDKPLTGSEEVYVNNKAYSFYDPGD